jgi:hypothetical protein
MVEYYNINEASSIKVNVEHSEDRARSQDGTVYLYKCPFEYEIFFSLLKISENITYCLLVFFSLKYPLPSNNFSRRLS